LANGFGFPQVDFASIDNVVLSEGKLQRSAQSARGQAFNLWKFLKDILARMSQRCFARLHMIKF